MPPPTPSHLETFAAKTDDWFRRANAALLNQLPCRAGCAQCCVGVFPITRLDARLLQEGLAQLPGDERARIADRAVEQMAALAAAEPRLHSSPFLDRWTDEDIDRVAQAFHDVPCPALSDNRLCSLYAFRPLTCRSMGIPTRETAVVNGACEVQTFIPIVRLSDSLEAEEQMLARQESAELAKLPDAAGEGEEVFLPYGFVPVTPAAPSGPSVAIQKGTMAHHAILVIDDDPDVRTALQLVLKKAGYQPLLADGGQAAIDFMTHEDQAAEVAAVLCDLEMPGMAGATVIAHFRAHHPMIPIVVLSGAAPAEFLNAVGQEGVGDWLRKPAGNDSVLEKVRAAVHLFELRKAGCGSKDR